MTIEAILKDSELYHDSRYLFHTSTDVVRESMVAGETKLRSGKDKVVTLAHHDPVTGINFMIVPDHTGLNIRRCFDGEMKENRLKGTTQYKLDNGKMLAHSERVVHVINELFGNDALPRLEDSGSDYVSLEEMTMHYNDIIREYDEKMKRYVRTHNLKDLPLVSPHQIWDIGRSGLRDSLYLRHTGSLSNNAPVSFWTLGIEPYQKKSIWSFLRRNYYG